MRSPAVYEIGGMLRSSEAGTVLYKDLDTAVDARTLQSGGFIIKREEQSESGKQPHSPQWMLQHSTCLLLCRCRVRAAGPARCLLVDSLGFLVSLSENVKERIIL